MNIKMTQPGRYATIEKGRYSTGIPREEADRINSICDYRGEWGRYLLNSVPEHDVEVQAIKISYNLVTLYDFRRFAEETGYITLGEADGWGWTWEWQTSGWMKKDGLNWMKPFGDGADIIYNEKSKVVPVMQLCWNDAEAYCRWLSGRDESTIRRLPSESEWEVFAGRMGVKSLKETGAATGGSSFNNSSEYMLSLVACIEKSNGVHKPGLVWEWTLDWFKSYPDGCPNREFGEVYKVLRGGSAMSHPMQRSREYRFRRCPTARSPFYGFRIAIA